MTRFGKAQPDVPQRLLDDHRTHKAIAQGFVPNFVAAVVMTILAYYSIRLEYDYGFIAGLHLFSGETGVVTPEVERSAHRFAVSLCVVTLTILHILIKPLMQMRVERFWPIMMVGMGLLLMGNPLITLGSDLIAAQDPFSEDSTSGGFAFFAVGGLLRVVLVVLSGFVAAWALLLAYRFVIGMYQAFKARERANEAAQGHRTVSTSRFAIDAHNACVKQDNRARAEQFAVAVVQGKQSIAQEIHGQLNGTGRLFVDIDDYRAKLEAECAPVEGPLFEDVARALRNRMMVLDAPLTQMTAPLAQMPREAQELLAEYADWLSENANFDAIFQATFSNEEAPRHG